MKKSQKKTGLGRGISALIPDFETLDEKSGNFFMCRIDQIVPNKYQPRTSFSETELEKLKESIVEQGILQPLLIRKTDNSYELIAGERRLRAAKKADLTHVPAIVREFTDEQMLEVSIIENVQRENLNALEEAEAYYRLISEFGYTQEKVAKKIGKNRSTIANFLRLRGLPGIIRNSLAENQISMGHARAILGSGSKANQLRAWETVIAKQLSVRETERLAKKIKNEPKTKQDEPDLKDTKQIKAIGRTLSKKMDSTVRIIKKGNKGRFEIRFKNEDEFLRLVALLNTIQ